LRYFPFTFLSGAHGFALFAPYLIAVLAVARLRLRRLRRKRLELAPVPVQAAPVIGRAATEE
jgi:amino acid transporter